MVIPTFSNNSSFGSAASIYAPSSCPDVHFAQLCEGDMFYIRAKKCNGVKILALADVERIRTHMGRAGLSLDVEACWPQAVHNLRTRELKRFDWGAMILQIRAYGMDAASAAEALNALQVDCSFHLTAHLEFEVWRQPVDPAALNAEMVQNGVEPPTLMACRSAVVPLADAIEATAPGTERFVLVRSRKVGAKRC